MERSLKTCRGCGEVLPLTSFYGCTPSNPNGSGKCKDCVRRRVARHRLANLISIRIYDRSRNNSPERVAARTAYTRKYRKENPEKYAAHMLVNNAVRDRRLTKKPCKVCGAADVEAHHEDYSKPLEVTWLCSVHHRQFHHGRIILIDPSAP